MARRYKYPPVDEAICEFRFESDSPWDLTVPGLVYEKLRADLPKREPTSALEATTRQAGPDTIEQQWVQVDRLRLLSEDEKTVAQISPHLLAVNRLRPYTGWEEFLPLVGKSLTAYQEVANPKGLQQISVRYINRITLEDPVELEDYFEFYPFVGQKLPQNLNSFIVGIQSTFNEGRDVLQMQMTSNVPNEPNTIAVVLDLLYFLGQPGTVPFEEVFGWIGNAHDRIEDAFEGCLKEALRERFGELEEE